MKPSQRRHSRGMSAVLRRAACILSLGVAVCRGVDTEHRGVTPVQKVVQLLEDLLAKAKEEKHAESVQYADFQQFCSDVLPEKARAIERESERRDLLVAELQRHKTEVERLAGEINVHGEEITQFKSDSDAAAAARDKERAAYLAMHQNYTESVNAVAKAIAALKAQNFERSGEAAAAAAALLQEDPDLTFLPEVPTSAYKPKSSEVITMLESLQDKFRAKIEELDKAEVSRQHAADMLQQDLTSQIDAAETARSDKSEEKGRHERKEIEVGADLDDVTKALNDDMAYHADLDATCVQKAQQFKLRQGLRAEEIATLEKAKEIISGTDVQAAADRRSITPVAKSTMFLQTRSGSRTPDSAQLQAALFLKTASARLNSNVLSALATHLQEDPFAKVKTLIEELIARLMTEATREAEHKGWCDTELGTNAHTRKTKSEHIDGLRVDIEELSADIAELREDCVQLQASITATKAAVDEAVKLRNAERTENEAAIADAQRGQAAVGQAIEILQEFYAQPAKAASLSQTGKNSNGQTPPPIFGDEPYVGKTAESGNVLAMLEVIKSEFARQETDTTYIESTAQRQHDKFLEDSNVAKAQMETEFSHKSQAVKDNEAALGEKQDELEKTEKQLEAANAEYEKLRPVCIDVGQTYEDRASRRKDEIEALKQALDILENANSQ